MNTFSSVTFSRRKDNDWLTAFRGTFNWLLRILKKSLTSSNGELSSGRIDSEFSRSKDNVNFHLDSWITFHFFLVFNLKVEKLEVSLLGSCWMVPLITENFCAFGIQSLLHQTVNIQVLHLNVDVPSLNVSLNSFNARFVGSKVALNSHVVRCNAWF